MGNHKYIATPEIMWQLFEKYREEIRSNPLQLVEQRKGNVIIAKGAQVEELPSPIIELPLRRPLTHEGFRNFGHRNNVSVEPYFANTDGAYTEFLTICSRIKNEIREDQIEGGMCGLYNPSITQRLNGLSEKTENKHEVEGNWKITMNLNK